MARQNTWSNGDGLIVGYGTHTIDTNKAAVSSQGGVIKNLVMILDGPTLGTAAPTALTRNPQGPRIPRGSTIVRATLVAKTAWTGTGTLTIGTWGSGADPEAVDDADGIDATIDVDAATGLDAIGATVACDGALVGISDTKAGATSNSDVTIEAFVTGSVTAGTAELFIEYIVPQSVTSIAV